MFQIFRCSVLWDPAFELSVIWMKDGTEIDLSNSRFSIDDSTNSLHIENLKFEDEGTHTCVASTSQGSSTDTGTLTVTGIPPKLIFGPSQQIIPEHSTIELLCTVEAFPQVEHVWYQVGNHGTDLLTSENDKMIGANLTLIR